MGASVTRRGGAADLRAELIERLAPLGVENVPWPARDDGFSSLSYGGKEFAHFHSDGELDLRLTKTVIEREGLIHPPDSRIHPNRSAGSPYIELRFERVEQLDEIVRLVTLAIARL